MGKTGSCSDGRAMLSKSLIQFSADGWGCVPSHPPYRPRPNYGRGNGSNGGLLQKDVCQHATASRTVVVSAPDPAAGHCGPTSLPETPGHSQASLAQSLVGSLLLSSGSWCTQAFVCALQESVSLVPWKFSSHWLSKSNCWIIQNSLFNFLGNHKSFSMLVAPFYIPTSNVR